MRGDFRDAWLLWRGLAGARALVVNLPVVARKRTLLTPLLALAIARIRGASTILVLHERMDLQPARRVVYSVYILSARTILFSSPFVRAGFESDCLGGRGRSTGLVPIPPNIARTEAQREAPASFRLAEERARGRVIELEPGDSTSRDSPSRRRGKRRHPRANVARTRPTATR